MTRRRRNGEERDKNTHFCILRDDRDHIFAGRVQIATKRYYYKNNNRVFPHTIAAPNVQAPRSGRKRL